MEAAVEKTTLARIVSLTRNELARLNNELEYTLEAGASVPLYLGLSHEDHLVGFAAVEKTDQNSDGSVTLHFRKDKVVNGPLVLPAEEFLWKRAAIWGDFSAVEIRTEWKEGEEARRKAQWQNENAQGDKRPVLQERIVESALWAKTIALALNDEIFFDDYQTKEATNAIAGVCQRVVEKAKAGVYRGEDDQELLDLCALIDSNAIDNYYVHVNFLSLKEKISEWVGNLNTVGEEDIQPCLSKERS